MICTTFLFIILGGEPHKTEHDVKIQNSAGVRCLKVYKGCLHRLYRTETRVYRAICKDPKGVNKVEHYKLETSYPLKGLKMKYNLGDYKFLKNFYKFKKAAK